jgi:hypothetical protein
LKRVSTYRRYLRVLQRYRCGFTAG